MSITDATQSVVVIGANGFVGRRVVARLSATEGLRPIIAARRPAQGGPDTFERRTCDAADAASLTAALAGATFAVNCVAGDGDTMLAATRNLCAAARAAGLRRIVHLSSMAVYGPATGLVDEAQALDPSGWYAEAKAGCEASIRDFAQAGGDAVILRPGCIHGPQSEQWTGRVGRLLQHRRVGDLGVAGDGICNLVYIDDVAAAIVAALQRPDIAGQAFNLGDRDPGTWNSYFMRFAQAIGATPVRRISPRWLKIETKVLAPFLKIGQVAAGRAGLGRLAIDPLPPSLLALWQQDIQLDHRKADAALGFARTPPDAAIASAAAWFTTRT